MKKARTQEERSQHTMTAVLDIAQKHFAEMGYGSVSTEAMLKEAGLTRGALYHHFANKQGLFEAVVTRIQEELTDAIATKSEKEDDPWDALLAGCFAWLESATKPETQRILLVDAPAVLGWERWQELDAEHGASLLAEGIEALVSAGRIEVSSNEALLHLLNGAMNQAALWVAQSPEPEKALREAEQVLERLLEGLLK